MKVELSKEEIAAISKTMAEYCRHQPDPMIASELLRPLRMKLENPAQEEPVKQDIPNSEEV
jgi:hypothetical protein